MNVGIATIYRFLSDLEKESKIHWYMCKGRKIYSKGRTNHVHFICESCNSSKHIKLDKIDFISDFKTKICHFQLDMFGTCINALLMIALSLMFPKFSIFSFFL